MSKHETGTVTKQTTGARWGGPGGVSPPGTAAVSKHETGTVIKQTTGAVSTHETGTVTKQTTGAVSTHKTSTVTTGAVSKHETVLEGGLRRYERFKPVIPVGTLIFERSKVCIRTENHTSANTSRFFVPWEPGGPSPNQHNSATPPRIWNIAIYGANIAAGLSGQKFERSNSANTSRFFVPWEAGGPSPNQHASATPPRICCQDRERSTASICF